MAQNLIILGANGNALDVLDIVESINAVSHTWRVTGILDDSRDAGTMWHGVQILGGLADAGRFSAVNSFVCAIGSETSHRARGEIIAKTGLDSGSFATLVHPRAAVSSRARIGRGSLVGMGACIAAGVVVGEHVVIAAGCIVGHDTAIDDHSVIAPGAVVSGSVHIGAGCYVGAGAVVRQQIHIGSGALVGMGAVVVKDVAPASCVVGNPARPLERGLARAATAAHEATPAQAVTPVHN
jgi:sugar O-acyltransferase (sialic acid O-acetyltransferase NeuD family)